VLGPRSTLLGYFFLYPGGHIGFVPLTFRMDFAFTHVMVYFLAGAIVVVVVDVVVVVVVVATATTSSTVLVTPDEACPNEFDAVTAK